MQAVLLNYGQRDVTCCSSRCRLGIGFGLQPFFRYDGPGLDTYGIFIKFCTGVLPENVSHKRQYRKNQLSAP
jgi:hypothetical protein